jgi:DNA polymerase-3 subunit epsilon
MSHISRIWFDLETTGLDPTRHAVIDVALLLEVDGSVVASFRAPMAPFAGAEVDPEALSVTGAGLEEIWDRETPLCAWGRLVKWIGSQTEERRIERFQWAGHNIAAFDLPFVRAALARHGYAIVHASHRVIDTCVLAAGLDGLDGLGVVNLPKSLGLRSLADHFGVEYEPHDPEEDAEAARVVYHAIRHRLVEWRR